MTALERPPQPLASTSQLLVTPSQQDGLSHEIENELRAAGCQLIQEMGILLDLPQSTLATAQVLLQRFYYVSSMSSFTVNEVAVASLYLSSKLCETPVRLRDLLNVYVCLVSRNNHLLKADGMNLGEAVRTFDFKAPSFYSQVFYDLRDALVVTEIQILKRLGFNMQVELPYSHMVNYCKILDLVGQGNDGVVQLAWGILNDALQTSIYATYPTPTIACFSILLATRLRRIQLPDQWWILFDAEWDDMWDCCGHVMRLWRTWGAASEEAFMEPGRSFEGQEAGQLPDQTTAEEASKHPVLTQSQSEREERWKRAWTLSMSKRNVRGWIAKVQDPVTADDQRG